MAKKQFVAEIVLTADDLDFLQDLIDFAQDVIDYAEEVADEDEAGE